MDNETPKDSDQLNLDKENEQRLNIEESEKLEGEPKTLEEEGFITMPEGYEYKSPFTKVKKATKEPGFIAPVQDLDSDDLLRLLTSFKENPSIPLVDKEKLKNLLLNATSGLLNQRYSEVLGDNTALAQYLELEGRKLGTVPLNTTLKNDTVKLTGQAARRRVAARLGTGREIINRLPHSGLIVILGNFTPGEIFQMQTNLIHRMEEIGTKTRGRILSTEDSHVIIQEVDFVLDHIIDTNVRGWTLDTIRDNLDVRDIPVLLAGALASMYPTGYPFLRSCEWHDDPEDPCDWTTLKGIDDLANVTRLDFGRIVHYDTDKFSVKQKRMLAMAMGSITEEDLVSYRDDFKVISTTTAAVNETGESQFKLVLKAPMYTRYRNESLRYISDVIMAIDTALAEAPDLGRSGALERRQQTLKSYMERIDAQVHVSWIERIIEVGPGLEITYGGDTEEERNDVFGILELLSANEDAYENTNAYVERFKRENLYAFTGIPDYRCPACERSQAKWTSYRTNIIPISISQYFFAIMVSNQGRLN